MTDYLKTFRALYYSQPFKDVWSHNVVNCPYGDYIFNSKDCYLSFELGGSQDCLFMDNSMKCQDCSDCSYCKHCQLCSNSLQLERCYHCHFCQYSSNCSDCLYSSNLFDCQNCLGCYVLRHKKYCIFNEQLSEAEYQKKKIAWLDKPEEVAARLQKIKDRVGYPARYIQNSQDCIGDYLTACHNCYQCFNVNSGLHSAYLNDCLYRSKMQDCFDIDNGGGCELCSSCYSVGHCYNSHFCVFSNNLNDCQYCFRCRNCKNCFGCVYLKDKEYWILNQPYSPKEYQKKIGEVRDYFIKQGISDGYSLVAPARGASNQ